MLSVRGSRGDPNLATVFLCELADGELIECVESVQPPFPRDEKWVLIVSTLKGCPVRCPICDAGTRYAGRLSAEEIVAQIDMMVRRRHPDGTVPAKKLKVQFARMGDPAFNPVVPEVLDSLPGLYPAAPGLMPSISTVAPAGTEGFFRRLKEVKTARYGGGRFQMQFSLHTSSEAARRELVPVRSWSFREMSRWGENFFREGDRRIALNFAPVHGYPVDAGKIRELFSPEKFMIKLTPVNPTATFACSGLRGVIDPDRRETADALVSSFRDAGFQTILSIGETRENLIGSNCGMYVGEELRGGRVSLQQTSNRSSPGDPESVKNMESARHSRCSWV
jgi:23S rRNA (adenine2503-C2)-methyltransferase